MHQEISLGVLAGYEMWRGERITAAMWERQQARNAKAAIARLVRDLKFSKYNFQATREETIEILTANVDYLTREQAEFLVRHLSDTEVERFVIGGSRINGSALPTSDLDLGYVGMTRNRFIKKIKNPFNERFSASGRAQGKDMIIDHTFIFPGFEGKEIPRIITPEEFFMRFGIRGEFDRRAGEIFLPSGYIGVSQIDDTYYAIDALLTRQLQR